MLNVISVCCWLAIFIEAFLTKVCLYGVLSSVLTQKHQSSNFFAALDDSGDEAPPKATAAKKKEPKAKPAPSAVSKPNERYVHLV